MKQTIPNLSTRPRRNSDPVFVWQPGPTRRKAGWKAVVLKDERGEHAPERMAIAQAHWLNSILAAWSKTDTKRLSQLIAAWTSGEEEREDGRKLLACPFIEPPFAGDLGKRMPAIARHVTAADLWANYEASKAFKKARPATQRAYRNQFLRIIEWLGNDPVIRLSNAAVEDYFELLTTPAAASLRLAAARVVFNQGIKDKVITLNPFSGLALEEPAARVRVWTAEEIAASIEIARKHKRFNLAFAIEIGLATAQRPAEICRLAEAYRLDGSGWRGWRIRQVKTQKIVEPVPDTFFVTDDFIERLAREHHQNVARFPNALDEINRLRVKNPFSYAEYEQVPYLLRENGRPYSVASLADEWKKFRPTIALEVPSIAGTGNILEARIQDLRDTAITSMANRGYSMLQICAQSGHEPSHVGDVLKHYVAMTGDLASSHVRAMLRAAQEKPV